MAGRHGFPVDDPEPEELVTKDWQDIAKLLAKALKATKFNLKEDAHPKNQALIDKALNAYQAHRRFTKKAKNQ